MKLDELIALADAAAEANPCMPQATYRQHTELHSAANPATIKQLCLLLKQCKEALMDFDYDKRMKTLAAIEEFEK